MSTIVETVRISHSDLPNKASELVQFFAEQVAKIPAEYRGSAAVSLDLFEYGFDIALKYKRPETPEEAKTRLQNQAFYASVTERREREELARLKSKYEPAPPPAPHTITFP